jgi:hypothetical protein
VSEPLVFRLVRQHQAEQEAKKARHSPGNARYERRQKGAGRSAKKIFSSRRQTYGTTQAP